MLGGIFKAMFSNKSSKSDKKTDKDIGGKLAIDLKENSDGFLNFIAKKSTAAKDEFFIIKEKLNNLLETNYQLGLKHLKNDHLNEAIFRFRFIKKFWPNHLDSYYQLAYCLVLKNKFAQSKQVLEELIAKDPNYGDHVTELLDMMNASQMNGSSQNQGQGLNKEQSKSLNQNQSSGEEQIMQDNQQA